MLIKLSADSNVFKQCCQCNLSQKNKVKIVDALSKRKTDYEEPRQEIFSKGVMKEGGFKSCCQQKKRNII
jgi:hypothetical protein